MTRLLQIFYGLRKKDSLNFAIFARTDREARVSSSRIITNDTFVSDSSFGIEVKWTS